MLNKTFIILQFGKPHKWTQKFIDHVQHLGQYGWYFKIITPNKFKSKGNVEIVKMNIDTFNVLCEAKLGINPKLFIINKGIPNFHVTDLMIYFGVLFEDYLRNVDYWGLIGIDCIVGRLDNFITDDYLVSCEIFSDDINTFNGNFSLLKNIPKINELFKRILNWKEVFEQGSCEGCVGKGKHKLYGTDEYLMTKLLRNTNDIEFYYPKYFLIHGHDRLTNHEIEIKDDGSLWELNRDMAPPAWEHARPIFGREIAYFHFSQSKKWPRLKY